MPSWTKSQGDEPAPGSKPRRPQRPPVPSALPLPEGEAAIKPGKAGPRIDKLMDLAQRALEETHYFECEHACLEALGLAHAARDYERMARILLPLQEARRQIRLLAVDTKKLFALSEPVAEDAPIKPGCYLIEPPLVGADARDLHDRATREEIPVMVLAREPAVKTVKLDRRPGDWPVVLIGPVTVRAYVPPPAKDKPTLEWYLGACEALGDRAIADADHEADPFGLVEDLYERFQTISDHEKLHQALEAACRAAAVEAAKPQPKRSKGPVVEDDFPPDPEDE
ncbi:MAG: hypothetical protein J0L61_12225 [Planctomycetes bacterium]|nr:hypothetical protein [Planctomycetota bacterium]